MNESIREKLEKEGVFKGFEGLEGLINADEFWEKQPYGTRLYYGNGVNEYLHRNVLDATVRILKEEVIRQILDGAVENMARRAFKYIIDDCKDLDEKTKEILYKNLDDLYL